MPTRFRLRAAAAAALLLLTAQPGLTHEGHDHGDEKKAVALPAAPRAEATSDAFELVVVAQDGALTIYLDRFATNEPVLGATVAVETPSGPVDAKGANDGTYRLDAPWAKTEGRYDLIVTVTKDDVADVLPITLDLQTPVSAEPRQSTWSFMSSSGWPGGWLALGAALLAGGAGGFAFGRRRNHAAALALSVAFAALLAGSAGAQNGPTRDTAQQLPDGSVFVPKSTQRILAIRTLKTVRDTYPRSIELPGRIIPDPDASGFVQASVGGRLSPPPGGFPRLGATVKKGDVLAYVTPPLQAIDASDMRQRQGELDQQINIVERRLARYETLLPSGAISKSQYEDTKAELQGLRDRRGALDTARREAEPLVAPVYGVIAEGTPVSGQIAQTNAIVFHIIDPARLWIEALSYEASPHLDKASARAGSRELNLRFRGAGFADRNQSIPIHFSVEGDASGVRAGQFVTVLAQTAERQTGLAVPRTSLVRNSAGQDVVFEHVAAERFQPRPVRVEPLDGERVLVSQGLEPGQRVVVQGAELLGHIR
jgi:hypothetical protein